MMADTSVGIDIGGTGVKIAVRANGAWSLGSSRRYLRPDRATLREAIREALAATGTGVPAGTPVGLCIPGLLSDEGDSIDVAYNVPGLVGWRFPELVHAALSNHAPRIVRTSDSEAAVTDWWSQHRSAGRVLGIVIGTGVGLCVLDEGVPLRVTDHGAGHLGQIDVGIGDPSDAPIASDGGRGGLEAYIGAEAVAAAGGVASAFVDGSDVLKALVRAIRICHAIYRPDVVVLLGGVGRRLSGHATLFQRVNADLTNLAVAGWRLEYGDDDHHAARGAAVLAAQV